MKAEKVRQGFGTLKNFMPEGQCRSRRTWIFNPKKASKGYQKLGRWKDKCAPFILRLWLGPSDPRNFLPVSQVATTLANFRDGGPQPARYATVETLIFNSMV